MKKFLLCGLVFSCFFSCQSADKKQEVEQPAGTETEATPTLRPDVLRVGYTSEKTNLLAAPDFGSPTVQIIDPLMPVEVLDTTDAFFYRARISSQGPGVTGYIDKVYLSNDLETATKLNERAGRKQ